MSEHREHYNSLVKKSLKLCLDHSNLVSYQDIKLQLKPFDLIAFRGGDLISNMISTLEKYKVGVGIFSHVGIVVTSDILPKYISNDKVYHLDPNRRYILESTFSYNVKGFTDGPPDIIKGTGKFGVQLRDLEYVIPTYITSKKTKIAWCPLINNPFNPLKDEPVDELSKRRNDLMETFTNFFNSYHDRFYEADIKSLLAAMFPSLRTVRNVHDKVYSKLFNILHEYNISENSCGPAGWQFCSELIANLYQTIGVLPLSFDPRDVLPVDFFGYDLDGIPPLVSNPIYIKDWDLANNPAVKYN